MVEKKIIRICVVTLASVALVIGVSVGISQRNQRRTTASYGKIADSTDLSMYENTCESGMISSSSKAQKVNVSSSKSNKASSINVSSSKSNKASDSNTAGVSSAKSAKNNVASISSSKSNKGTTESLNCQPIYDKCTGPMNIGSGKGKGGAGVSTSSSKANKPNDFGSEDIGTGNANEPVYPSVSRAPSVDTMGCPTPRTPSPVSLPVIETVTMSPTAPAPETGAPTIGLESIITLSPAEVPIVTETNLPTTLSPTYIIFENTYPPTLVPTSGATPTVSKEVTGPPTLPLRGSVQ